MKMTCLMNMIMVKAETKEEMMIYTENMITKVMILNYFTNIICSYFKI